MSLALPDELIHAIQNTSSFVVCAHVQPDGDALGSSIALYYALTALGKNCILYNEDGLPKWLSFLETPHGIIADIHAFAFEPECIIALDCGDPKRLGDQMFSYMQGKKSINIDHHLGNPNYGTLANWVDPTKAATGEMVAGLIDALDVSYTSAIAEALYVAISSDTGNFSFGNTQQSTVDLFARLLGTPISVADIRVKMDNNASLDKLKLWGRLYQDIQVLDEGRFAYAKVPYSYLQTYKVTHEALEGFIEQIRSIVGVRVAMLLREDVKHGQHFVKVSMRSHGADNVQKIVATLGGGGHKNAAGAKITDKTMDEVITIISNLVHKMW